MSSSTDADGHIPANKGSKNLIRVLISNSSRFHSGTENSTVPGAAGRAFGKWRDICDFRRVLSLATVRHVGDLELLVSISHSKLKKPPVLNIG